MIKYIATRNMQFLKNKLEHHWNNDIERILNTPYAKEKAYDYSNVEEQNIPITKSQKFYDFNESKVPLLSDYEKVQARKKGKMFESGDALQNIPKKNHQLHNVFLQSHLQNQLNPNAKNRGKPKAPNSHHTLNNKEQYNKPTNYAGGRPLFNIAPSNSHMQNISAGRQRTFYSSHVF